MCSNRKYCEIQEERAQVKIMLVIYWQDWLFFLTTICYPWPATKHKVMQPQLETEGDLVICLHGLIMTWLTATRTSSVVPADQDKGIDVFCLHLSISAVLSCVWQKKPQQPWGQKQTEILLEFFDHSSTHPQKRVQWSVFHVLHHNHHGSACKTQQIPFVAKQENTETKPSESQGTFLFMGTY